MEVINTTSKIKTDKISVIIADDHKLFRQGIIELLTGKMNVEIISEVENGSELVDAYFLHKPDLIIVDIAMPILTGIEALEQIKKKDPLVKAMFLSMHYDEFYLYQIYKYGGKGLLSKNIVIEELAEAISVIVKGGIYFGKDISESDILALEKKYSQLNYDDDLFEVSSLSKQEKQVLWYIGESYSSQQIANVLNISKRTVDTHRVNIMGKINAKTLFDLHKFAIKYVEKNPALLNKIF